MSRGGQKWYSKETYKSQREPFDPGDGSLIEIVPEAYRGNPFTLKITRVWPDNRVSTIYLEPPRPGLNPSTKYLFVDDPPPASQQREFQTQLQNGTYRPPYAVTAAVPGNKPGDNYHPGTDRYYNTRQEFTKYLKDNNLELVGPSDAKNFGFTKGYGEEADHSKSVSAYDARKGPPTPQGFEGVRWHYAPKE